MNPLVRGRVTQFIQIERGVVSPGPLFPESARSKIFLPHMTDKKGENTSKTPVPVANFKVIDIIL